MTSSNALINCRISCANMHQENYFQMGKAKAIHTKHRSLYFKETATSRRYRTVQNSGSGRLGPDNHEGETGDVYLLWETQQGSACPLCVSPGSKALLMKWPMQHSFYF